VLYREYNPAQLAAGFEATPKFADFQDWSQKAVAAKAALIAWMRDNPDPPSQTEAPVEKGVYGALKGTLSKYFDGKCAYCDSLFEVVDWGDLDHYRPKLKVAGNTGSRGYYWLTYEVENLLPSCPVCNRGGKRALFPVDPKNTHVTEPGGDLTREHPLLLRPYDISLKDLKRHFEYKFEVVKGLMGRELAPTGFVDGLTEEGKQTIEVFDLNRKELREARRKSQKEAISRLANCFREALLDEALDDLFSPAQQHAAAVRATCDKYFEFRARLNQEKLKEYLN
jgi:hypothetical protein